MIYEAEGGHANVDKGNALGIVPPLFKKTWFNISSKVGLFDGSKTNILVIKPNKLITKNILLAASEMGTWSGN